MTKFIETSPDAFPVLAVELFNKFGKLIIEAPTYKEAALLSGALSSFKLKSCLFAPQFLLLERGGKEQDIQKAYAEINKNDVDIIVSTPLADRLFLPDDFAKLHLKQNCRYKISDIVETLAATGYERVKIVRDSGEFALRGDILDVGIFISGRGVRFEFFDEELENISLFRFSTQRNGKKLEEIEIPTLFFSNKLQDNWQKIVEEKATRFSTKELLEAEEIILSGVPDKWDIFPIIAGKTTLLSRLKATKVRVEKVRAETEIVNDFNVLDKERKSRIGEGRFLPFDMVDYFSQDEVEFDIEIGSLFPIAADIEKFPVVHQAFPAKFQNDPLFVLKRLAKENDVLVVFAKPNEIDALIEIGEKGNLSILPVEEIPLESRLEATLVIDKKEWFAVDEIVVFPTMRLACVSSESFNFSGAKSKRRESAPPEYNENKIFELSSLKVGEFVVHYKFGIAVYLGTKRMNETDCLVLRYENEDKLYIPVYNMHYIYRYRWEEGIFPRISSLRSAVWEQTISRVKREIEQVATKILELYAQRSAGRGAGMKIDTQMYREFSSHFPFKETREQAISIRELEEDLLSPEITDRLLCGDVGFGKTEVAMRGCMIAVANGMQAAILAPTTALAFQHLHTLQERFSKTPVRVEMLSRLYEKSKQNQILKDIKSGLVDIVVGTHRILSKDVEFRNLGFLVIDEEHRFGVVHKEQIKEMKREVATLSMTATPIPRTLQLSLLGIRKISFIRTPPSDRKNIQTFVLEYSEEIIKEAVLAELSRGGQIYFVHNRIADLKDIAFRLKQLVPNLKIVAVHGQMDGKELGRVMVDFVNRKYDLLLATSLIESGIDIPLVNTIIIDRADMFGMAQLYQLRGRVGRWNRVARAYLFVPNLSAISKESYARLAAIKRFDKLGSGYDVAMEDLNIRGGGNILGMSQSGKLKTIGYDMYLEMLKNRIEELKTGAPHVENEFEISTDLNADIPEEYIADTEMRIGFYRKIASLRSFDELNWIKETLREMFGKIPESTENLFNLTRIKIASIECGAVAVSVGREEFSITLGPKFIPKSMERLFSFLEAKGGVFVGESAIKFKTNKRDQIEQIVKELTVLGN